jgi:hypothetical protein
MISEVNNELEKMWKEAVVAQFKILFRNFLEGPRKTMKYFGQNSRPPGRDMNQRPPEYEAGVLTTRPHPSVTHGHDNTTQLSHVMKQRKWINLCHRGDCPRFLAEETLLLKGDAQLEGTRISNYIFTEI